MIKYTEMPLGDAYVSVKRMRESVSNYARHHKLQSAAAEAAHPTLPSSAASPRQGPAAGPCPSPPPGSCTLLHVGSYTRCYMSFGFRQLSSFRLCQDFLSPPQLIVTKKKKIRSARETTRGEAVRDCGDQTPLVRGGCAKVVPTNRRPCWPVLLSWSKVAHVTAPQEVWVLTAWVSGSEPKKAE